MTIQNFVGKVMSLLLKMLSRLVMGFPGGSEVKSICLECGRPRFNPWVGKIPWSRKWQPIPVFLLGEFHGRKSLAGYRPWDHKESDTTEELTHPHNEKKVKKNFSAPLGEK